MDAQPDEVRRLRDLHEAYIRKVNAALARGRDDLVRDLVDDHLEEALRIMKQGRSRPQP